MKEGSQEQANFDYLIQEGILEDKADERVDEDVIRKINALPWADVKRIVEIHHEVGSLPAGVSQFI